MAGHLDLSVLWSNAGLRLITDSYLKSTSARRNLISRCPHYGEEQWGVSDSENSLLPHRVFREKHLRQLEGGAKLMKKTPSNFIVKELLSLDNIFLELENCLLSDSSCLLSVKVATQLWFSITSPKRVLDYFFGLAKNVNLKRC